jgi:hypothetical protein
LKKILLLPTPRTRSHISNKRRRERDHTNQTAKQIKIPDPDKERRIINCEASYVDCSNLPLYGPCCTEAARAASRKPADLPNENVKDDENVKRRRARLA